MSDQGESSSNRCLRCGFHWIYEHGVGLVDSWTWVQIATLQEFELNDAAVGLEELGAHLQRMFSDVYMLAPHRFEELVGDVYQQLGYSVRRTPKSKDGGYDLFLLEHATGKQIIVEVKRYRETRKVGVEITRQVLGVQFLDNFHNAVIVTTSSFTRGAVEISRRVNANKEGYSLDLVGATEFLDMLGVYNTKLPPLDRIDLRRFPDGL